MNHIFIGYDDRESEAAEVLAFNIKRLAERPVETHFLKHKKLRDDKVFSRSWSTRDTGQTYDDRDGRPFSTQFSHSRFLVPHIAKSMGLTGWVLFMDCDMLFVSDPTKLWDELDSEKALACVKHNADTRPEGIKMDGMLQLNYGRKLWSSFLAFNLDNPINSALTVQKVNYAEGKWLHGLTWCPESEIQGLDEGWNWCVGLSPTHNKYQKSSLHNIHWTIGGPWMEGYEDVMYAANWRKEQKLWLEHRLKSSQAGALAATSSTPSDSSKAS